MHFIKRLVFLSCILFSTLFGFAQIDTCGLQVSLLTCSPGSELYSTFGHTAIRVKDSSDDLVFNYGTFDFMDPAFYSKFVRGKLNYFLSVELYQDFRSAYEYEKRSITEQVIKLDCSEKAKLVAALEHNAREENKYYKYDFLFDNCTTRARDMIQKNCGAEVAYRNILPARIPSFRNLIHSYLDKGEQYWSKFGIDILLGSKLDNKVSNLQAMFLPEYLLKGFDSASKGPVPLVESSSLLLSAPVLSPSTPFRPFYLFLITFVLIVIASLTKNKWSTGFLKVFDRLFFLVLGLLGALLVFMWLGTDHVVCSNNLNLLWALPTHLIIAFIPWKNKPFIKKYFRIVLFISILLVVCWPFLPQQLNNAIMPVMWTIIVRSFYLSKSRT